MTETPKPRLTARAILIAVGIGLAGIAGYQAIADTKPVQHAAAYMGHGGWHSGWGGRHGAMTVEEMDAKIERFVAHAAIEAEATDDQRDQIAAIAKTAAAELRPLRDAMWADGKRLQELLLADVVNPSEVEAVRAARLADFDAKSKIFTTAATDIAAILTPDQRRLLEERIKKFKGRREH
jgi:Spy/CpxP family protein refolding chaperone